MDNEDTKDQFLAVYDEYGSAIYRFCLLKVSSKEQAEDLTQEVFMRFWQTLRKQENVDHERALLYTIARNLIIDWYRKHKEQSLDVLAEAGYEFANEDHKDIERNAQVRELLGVVHELDHQSREVVLLRYVEGLSPKDIATVTGETANAISVRLNRAIKKVQQRIRL